LSQSRGSHWLVPPAASAAELLDGVECEADDVTALVDGEHGPDHPEDMARPKYRLVRSGSYALATSALRRYGSTPRSAML
jgi:hypothetical protein